MHGFDVVKLVEILQIEYKLYQEIKELGVYKRDFIINEKTEELEGVVKKEEAILKEIINLESNRNKITGDKGILDIIGAIDSNYADELKELRVNMSMLLDEIQDVNKLNADLISNSLQLTNMTLNLLTNNQRQGTYGKQGKTNAYKGKSKSFINHKA